VRNKSDLRGYQDRFATALYENDELLLVARPGFGKTISALTAITELLRDKVIRHALVIAPKRVATVVWPDEIEQWAHVNGLRYAVLDEAPHQRGFLLKPDQVRRRDVTLIGIDLVPWLVEHLNLAPDDSPLFDLLVIDEASRLRNPRGKRAQKLAKIAPRWKMIWGLTGTLRPSGPLDLFMPSRVVTRGRLWGRSFDAWRKRNFYPVDFQGYEWEPLPGAEDRLNAEIAPLIVTVKDDELVQPKPTIVLDRVTLPTAARTQYDSMQRLLFAKIAEGSVTAASAGVATGKLAQLANGFLYDNEGVAVLAHDAKRRWLEDLVEDATGPTLLIYEFLEDLKLMQGIIGDLPYLGAGASDARAKLAIELWNAGKLPFMALHPASGGHGLNLQHGGSDMAWMSPTWSPENWEQTIARINRSGQKRQVVVRVCVASGTVDELKLDRVHHKMTAQAAFEAYLRRWQTQNKTA
jgi:SNF2-related domain